MIFNIISTILASFSLGWTLGGRFYSRDCRYYMREILERIDNPIKVIIQPYQEPKKGIIQQYLEEQKKKEEELLREKPSDDTGN